MFDLSAKLDARDAELRMSRERVAHPALLEGVVDHLCSLGCSHGYQEKLGEVMPFSSQGSAFLQTVLLAASPDRYTPPRPQKPPCVTMDSFNSVIAMF